MKRIWQHQEHPAQIKKEQPENQKGNEERNQSHHGMNSGFCFTGGL
jgi:hypothetical protein